MTNPVFSSAFGQGAVPPDQSDIQQWFKSCLLCFECSVFAQPRASSVRKAGLQGSGSRLCWHLHLEEGKMIHLFPVGFGMQCHLSGWGLLAG